MLAAGRGSLLQFQRPPRLSSGKSGRLEGRILRAGPSSAGRSPLSWRGQTYSARTARQPRGLPTQRRRWGAAPNGLFKGLSGIARDSGPRLRAKTTTGCFHTANSSTRKPKTGLQRSKARRCVPWGLPEPCTRRREANSWGLAAATRRENEDCSTDGMGPSQQVLPVESHSSSGTLRSKQLFLKKTSGN